MSTNLLTDSPVFTMRCANRHETTVGFTDLLRDGVRDGSVIAVLGPCPVEVPTENVEQFVSGGGSAVCGAVRVWRRFPPRLHTLRST